MDNQLYFSPAYGALETTLFCIAELTVVKLVENSTIFA